MSQLCNPRTPTHPLGRLVPNLSARQHSTPRSASARAPKKTPTPTHPMHMFHLSTLRIFTNVKCFSFKNTRYLKAYRTRPRTPQQERGTPGFADLCHIPAGAPSHTHPPLRLPCTWLVRISTFNATDERRKMTIFFSSQKISKSTNPTQCA